MPRDNGRFLAVSLLFVFAISFASAEKSIAVTESGSSHQRLRPLLLDPWLHCLIPLVRLRCHLQLKASNTFIWGPEVSQRATDSLVISANLLG